MNPALTKIDGAKISDRIGEVALLLALCVQCASAQENLITFVNNPQYGATPLQTEVGTALQRVSTTLRLSGGFDLSDPQQVELYGRCNELVGTSQIIQGVPPLQGRGFQGETPAELLLMVQQVSGSQVTSQGKLAKHVAAGQFTNISGRLNALRLGASHAGSLGKTAAAFDMFQTDRISGLAAGKFATPLRVYSADAWSPSVGAAQDRNGMSTRSHRIDMMLADDGASPSSVARREATSTDARESGSLQPSNPWGIFTEGSYNWGDRDPGVNDDGFSFHATSVTVGGDYNFGSAVAGASIGYDSFEADFSLANGGDTHVESLSGSLFGAWASQRTNLNANAIVSYGSLETEITRNILYGPAPCPFQTCGTNRTLVGKPDGRYFAGGVALGYDVSIGSWELSPSLGVNHRDLKIDRFTESDSGAYGAMALRYEEQDIPSTRSILSLGIARPISAASGVFTPTLRLEWHHEFEGDTAGVAASYAAAPIPCSGCTFTLPRDPQTDDFGVIGLGVPYVLANRLQGYFYYQAMVGVSQLTSHSFAVGLRKQF